MPTELKTMIGKKFGTHDWMPLAASLDRRMTMSFMHHIHLYLAEMLMWSLFLSLFPVRSMSRQTFLANLTRATPITN